MLTVASTHGKAYQQNGAWKVQCRFTTGEEGTVSAPRKSVLRRRLLERGVTTEQVEQLFETEN